MFCPNCGKENANTFGYCNACGKPLTPPVAPAAGTAPAAAPAPTPGAAPVVSPGPTSPVAYTYPPVGIGQPMSAPPKKSGSVVAIVIIVLLAAGIGGYLYLRNFDNEEPEARIRRLVREAAGTQPIKTGFAYNLSKMKQFDDDFREQYRKLFHANQDYIAAVKNADISAASNMGKAETFVDPSSFSEGLKQLHAVYDLDMAQEQKVAEIIANVRHVIETSSWSASDRQGAMRGFDTGIAEPLAKRKTAVDAEQAWVQSIDDVYDYANRNHPAFVLQDGQLLINDGQVLEEFNSRVRTMNSRRTEFLQAKQAYDTYQQQLFQKMGVDPKEMGIQ